MGRLKVQSIGSVISFSPTSLPAPLVKANGMAHTLVTMPTAQAAMPMGRMTSRSKSVLSRGIGDCCVLYCVVVPAYAGTWIRLIVKSMNNPITTVFFIYLPPYLLFSSPHTHQMAAYQP